MDRLQTAAGGNYCGIDMVAGVIDVRITCSMHCAGVGCAIVVCLLVSNEAHCWLHDREDRVIAHSQWSCVDETSYGA
jgi:hypothetical protein